MNLRLSPQGLLVDHVLGWAVQYGDTEAAGADASGTAGVVCAARGGALDGQAASGGGTKDSRSGSLRFPFFG
jgi:hypothetical protein